MAICIGCGRDVPGLDEGEFCRTCGGGDDFDYEETDQAGEDIEPREPEDA